jgi:hypothetical protein
MTSIPYPVNAGEVDSISYLNLEMPGSHPKFMNFTILGGQTLKAGSVLGLVTASRKLKLAAAAAGDGSQAPMAVLNTDISTFAADGTTPKDMTFDVMVSGAVLNPAALVLGAGITATAAQDALRPLGFQFRSPGFSG